MRFFNFLILCATLIPLLVLLNLSQITVPTTTTTQTTTTIPTTTTTQTTTTTSTTQTTTNLPTTTQTTTTVPTTSTTNLPTTVPSGLINITAGLGLDGGTITDFGTISLSNISNVEGVWPDINSITVNEQGRIIQVNNSLIPGISGNFSNPQYISIDEYGRITDIVNGPVRKFSFTFNQGTYLPVVNSVTPVVIRTLARSLSPKNLFLVSGLGVITSGTLILGIYTTTTNVLLIEKNYTFPSGRSFIFLLQYMNLSQNTISVNLRASVTSGGSATVTTVVSPITGIPYFIY